MKKKGYKLSEGDILKLGRVEFKIIELNDQSSSSTEKFNQEPIFVIYKYFDTFILKFLVIISIKK